MPIEAVISSSPSLNFEADTLPKSLRTWSADLQGADGPRIWWIVPTSRRRRQIVHQLTEGAALLPRVLTLDGLLEHLTGYARFNQPLVGNVGRLIRIARAWRRANGLTAPLSAGRVLQLDRVVSEWRECGFPPARGHPHSAFVRAFITILYEDGSCDRPGWIESLAKEVADGKSPLALHLAKTKCVLFDGFHRISASEEKLIEALGKHTQVRLWLVGAPGQPFHANVATILNGLGIDKPILDPRPAPRPLAKLGRALFADSEKVTDSIPLQLFEAPTAAAEIDAIACQIKAMKRAGGAAVRLADFAVVAPDDGYISLLRSTFAASGIDCSPAAEMFDLAASRPARVLLAALRIVRHGWPIEALFDFLRQPLVVRKLEPRHLLNQLQELSPRTTLHRRWQDWQEGWLKAIDAFEKGGRDEDENREDNSNARPERAGELRELVRSIGKVLEPVRQMQKELEAAHGSEPAKLAAAIGRLLEAIGMNIWLSPSHHPDWKVIPTREWEIDQLAFSNLKDVLGELAETPADDFPRDQNKQIDIELVLQLVLAAERFQTSAEDDAGVQILKSRTIRGSHFRAIFAVGLVEGKVPPIEGEDLPTEDGSDAILKSRREQRALEQQYLFTQLFESASERLFLSRPQREGDTELMESPFLRRVKEKLATVPFQPPNAIVAKAKAVFFADRLDPKVKAPLNDWLTVRDIWKTSRQDLAQMRIKDWALPLLNLRYPAERLFSATALEKYAACPFQHFAIKTLGLDELERDDTAMRAGTFVHEVLEDFFKEWQELTGPKEFKPDTTKPMFQRIFQEKWKNQVGLLDPTLEHDFNNALTDAFVRVAGHLVENKFQQVEAEWGFEVDIRDQKGRSIKLNGKIDRIDRGTIENETVELICDFKTGTVSRGKKLVNRIAQGRLLQLPLYAYARQLKENVPVKHGIYVQLNRRVKGLPDEHGQFIVNVGELLPMNSRSTKVPFEPEKAGMLAVELAHQMREGVISLTVFDVDHPDPACGSFCSARHACRQPKGY